MRYQLRHLTAYTKKVQAFLYKLCLSLITNFKWFFPLCLGKSGNTFYVIRLLIDNTFDCHITFYLQISASIISEIPHFYLVKWTNWPTLKNHNFYLGDIATQFLVDIDPIILKKCSEIQKSEKF